MARGININHMEVSPVGLSKVERGEEMDIAGEEVRLPQVKKIACNNQEQKEKSFLGKMIRPALPTSQKACSRRARMS